MLPFGREFPLNAPLGCECVFLPCGNSSSFAMEIRIPFDLSSIRCEVLRISYNFVVHLVLVMGVSVFYKCGKIRYLYRDSV